MLQCHFLELSFIETLLSLILSFIPNYAPYVEQGFNALRNIHFFGLNSRCSGVIKLSWSK